MKVEQKKVHHVSWANTFNTEHKRFGMSKAWETAEECGYPYIAWNGWVYETASAGIEKDRIVLAQELPT